MAVQMDKPSELSSTERAQHLYNKNVELENSRRKSAHARVPSDPNVWQQIRENYEAIILEDHSFSEQHEIELALWQLHYKRIEELRALYTAAVSSNTSSVKQNGKTGPARPDRLGRIRSQFKTFLSEASGFYHDLMLKIRAKYGLPLGYFSEDPENQIFLSKDGQKFTEVKKGLISCHRCFIYLGDLARYKGLYGDGESKSRDFAAASSYYMQASSLWPISGNPHHQLAILAAYHSDELVAIYRYFRSLAAENSFSTARDNLIIAFERNRQSYSQLLGEVKNSTKTSTTRMNGKGRGRNDARPSLKDNKRQTSPSKERTLNIPETFKAFCVKFVRVNGVLFTRTSLETFTDVLLMAKNDFLLLLSSGLEEKHNFGSDSAECGFVIVRLAAILIYTVHNVNRESENQSYADILQRSVLLQNAYTAIFEFMGHIVERCLQLQDPVSSYLLPGVLVFVEWLACHPDVVSGCEGEKQADVRFFFWNSCISFLNKLLSSRLMNDDEDVSCFFNMSKYEEGETANRFALWEDFELRGFLPLLPAQQILDFSRKNSFGNDDGIKEKRKRVHRIIAAGKSFVNVVLVGQHAIRFDHNLKKFVLGAEPQPSTNFAPNDGSEMLMLSDMNQTLPVDKETSTGILKPAAPLVDGEDEEEEEVIVFKPSTVDKQFDGGYPVLPSSGDRELVGSMPSEDLGVRTRSVSAPQSAALRQNGFHSALTAAQNLQPIQLNTSGWLAGQHGSMMNGFKNFSLMDKGNVINNSCDNSQIAAPSLPLSNSVNFNSGNLYPPQVSEMVMPVKTDYNMSFGTDVGIGPLTGQIFPANSRKSPVSRPVKQVGPPPGFTFVAPKYADDQELGSNIKEESPLTDDYSWLDGYQTPSSTKQSTDFSVYPNLNGSLYDHIGKSSGIPAAISFPFPGKQTSGFQTPTENHKIWQDDPFPNPDNLKFLEQQEQRGNQQCISLPEYQGQSLWQGRYLV